MTPVGAELPVAVDVRVIAAANEDVQEAVRQKRFRLDLYHRLAMFPILLPPLRERTEDLPVLIRHRWTFDCSAAPTTEAVTPWAAPPVYAELAVLMRGTPGAGDVDHPGRVA